MSVRLTNTKMMYNVPLRMRDGVELMCDVIRPDTEERLPTILVRTAYLKENVYNNENGRFLIGAFQAVARGYNFVVQDARGTGWSGGECDPSGHQAEDGYDTVEAIAQMPWSDGNVGMVGESFLGYVCLEAARLQPPHLRCIVPCEAGWQKNPYFHRYGVPTATPHGWCYGRALDRDTRLHHLSDETKRQIQYMMAHDEEFRMHLPLTDLPQNTVEGVPGLDKFREILEHIGDDAYLAELGRDDAFEQITVPVMHVTGWLDPELNTTIYNYLNFKTRGGSPLTRENMKLIVGPWPHGCILPGQFGGVSFGPQGSGAGYGVDEKILAFCDRWLKGIDSEFMQGDPVHVFVMGKNMWETKRTWPPENAAGQRWYLHSTGKAGILPRDGRLNRQEPQDEPFDSYDYDPGDPIPTIPRNTESARFADQTPIEERADILVYNTEPFAQDMLLQGAVKLRFFAASSAVDTDFAAKLLLVHPDGRAVEIYATLIRARYRNGRTPQFLKPGEIVAYEMEISHVCLNVGRGYGLRLELCSCLFPIADRNTNLGGKIGFESEYATAHQKIYHDAAHPSCLILPVVE